MDKKGFGTYNTPVDQSTLVDDCLESLNVYLGSLERRSGTIFQRWGPPRYRSNSNVRWTHDRITD